MEYKPYPDEKNEYYVIFKCFLCEHIYCPSLSYKCPKCKEMELIRETRWAPNGIINDYMLIDFEIIPPRPVYRNGEVLGSFGYSSNVKNIDKKHYSNIFEFKKSED